MYRPDITPAAPPKSSSINASRVFWGVVGAVVVTFGLRFVSGKKAAGAPWYQGASGYERALADQKTSNKPILLYFHTEWCGYCKQLENNVFSTSTFGSRYGSMLKVKVNPEESREEASLAARYQVRGFPTVYVITPAGDPREPIVGYAPPDQYYAALTHAAGN